MNFKFPVKYYEGNIVFGEKNVWAYYELEGYHYDFLSDDRKMELLGRLSSFYWDNTSSTHLLVVPRFRGIKEVAEEYSGEISGDLKEIGIRHMEDVSDILSERYGNTVEYTFYIGVKLEINEMGTILSEIGSAWKNLKKSLYQVSDLGYCIDEKELDLYKRYEIILFEKIKTSLNVIRVSEHGIQYLIERNFKRDCNYKELIDVKPYYQKKDGKRYIEGSDMLRLTESLIDESNMRYLKVSNDEENKFTTFMTVSKIPYNMHFPGCEYMYFVNKFEFPVELSIRIASLTSEMALKMLARQKQSLKAESDYTAESGGRVSNNVLIGEEELHDLESHLERTEMPLLEVFITFAISGKDESEMQERVKLVKSIYRKQCKMILEQPQGDQFLLFNEFLPSADVYVRDYIHYMEPDTLASGMLGATKQLGNTSGFPVGFSGLLNRIVYLNPSLPAQNIVGSKTNSLSISFTGSLGGGKSYCANLISYLAVISGARILIIDPKGERENWLVDLKDLDGQVKVITLSSEEKYRGLLDPFVLLSGKDAEELALSIATYFTGVKNTDTIYFAALADAIERVVKDSNPCMMKLVELLLNHQNESVKDLGRCLKSFSKLSFASLIFGDGVKRDTISLNGAMNILQIQNLQLPSKDSKPEDYSLIEILSIGMMIPINAFALKFIASDRSIYKIVMLEEAWSFLSNSQGKAVTGKLLREGRSLNAGIYIVTQNTRDFDSDFKNLIGIKFAFRSDDLTEVESILEYFDLPITSDNIELVRGLPNGYCLFKDMFGRVGVVEINVIFKDLDKAFDTRPPKQRG